MLSSFCTVALLFVSFHSEQPLCILHSLSRFYQMDKTCLQDHIGKIRAALCDKGIFLFVLCSVFFMARECACLCPHAHSTYPTFHSPIYTLLHLHTDPCVMCATLPLFQAMIQDDVSAFKDLVPSFVSILKQITDHRLPKDYDYHRIPSPWIQVSSIIVFFWFVCVLCCRLLFGLCV